MAKKGIVLMNLGSPDSPSTSDVRKYLRQFLMDERVIDIPYLSRFFLINTIIAPLRAPRSAKLYKSIWTKEGSPLLVHSKRLKDLIQKLRPTETVVMAMRYGHPDIEDAFDELSKAGVVEVLLLPLYPHYAMSSYETAVVQAMDLLKKKKYGFDVQTIRPYYDDDRFLNALTESIRPHLKEPFDHVLFSYHGIPERHVIKTDPTGSHCLKSGDCCSTASVAHKTCYRHQCFFTTQKVASDLGLHPDSYSSSFQSRLGRDPWLQPYTAALLPKLPARGIKRLIVVCPAFSADCLETLEEMDVEGRDLFLNAGAESFVRVPCLNTDQLWVEAINSWFDDIAAGNKEMIVEQSQMAACIPT